MRNGAMSLWLAVLLTGVAATASASPCTEAYTKCLARCRRIPQNNRPGVSLCVERCNSDRLACAFPTAGKASPTAAPAAVAPAEAAPAADEPALEDPPAKTAPPAAANAPEPPAPAAESPVVAPEPPAPAAEPPIVAPEPPAPTAEPPVDAAEPPAPAAEPPVDAAEPPAPAAEPPVDGAAPAVDAACELCRESCHKRSSGRLAHCTYQCNERIRRTTPLERKWCVRRCQCEVYGCDDDGDDDPSYSEECLERCRCDPPAAGVEP